VIQANDIKKAFLQIRTHESEKDALRFHWRPISLSEVESYRFTRVFFGLAPSPFLLGGVLESHLDKWAKKYPEETEHLRRSFYVDDVLSCGQNVHQARTRKTIATEIMNDASLELHKWHSNEPQVEYRPHSTPYEEQSYAKQQLQAQSRGSKLLGIKWNKEDDTIAVQFPEVGGKPTKREALAKLAKVYDPVGRASPSVLQGKQIFRGICDAKASWDSLITKNLRMQFQRWEESLPGDVTRDLKTA